MISRMSESATIPSATNRAIFLSIIMFPPVPAYLAMQSPSMGIWYRDAQENALVKIILAMAVNLP